MRKMYFAMIPKRSFLESAAIAAGVGAGLVYGCKWLVGEEKFNEYKGKLKSKVFDSGAAEFDAAPAADAGYEADAACSKEEDDIVERIRRAAARGVEKIVK